eukprot:199450-Rhodomonas_salina.2
MQQQRGVRRMWSKGCALSESQIPLQLSGTGYRSVPARHTGSERCTSKSLWELYLYQVSQTAVLQRASFVLLQACTVCQAAERRSSRVRVWPRLRRGNAACELRGW